MALDVLQQLKLILREKDCPFFSEDELEFYLEKNGNDLNSTVYECLMVKSENTTLSVSGLECADTSQYFRRLAQQYRPSNSGILSGG